MKLVKQNIAKDGSGTVTLQPEEPEDMVRGSNLPHCALRNFCIIVHAKMDDGGNSMHDLFKVFA